MLSVICVLLYTLYILCIIKTCDNRRALSIYWLGLVWATAVISYGWGEFGLITPSSFGNDTLLRGPK